MFSTIKDGKTTVELSEEYSIPLSSVYKKIAELESLGLIYIEKRIISDHGKKFKVYRSKIKGADIKIREIEPIVYLFPSGNLIF